MVHCQHETDNNWAIGQYAEGAGLANRFKELTDKQADKCDALEGFLLTYLL
jgi:hypothetical protein